jgi:hypothetical protein
MKGERENMRRAILILAVFIIALVPFLSACDTGEGTELIYWAKLWAIVHDITDEDGNPNFGAVTRFAAVEVFGIGGSTGDTEGDAAIDNAHALNDIRQASDEADQGWEALYKGQNINSDVLPHYDQAVKLRDKDWSYRNERGIANLEDLENPDNAQAARDDFNKANELAKKSGKPAEYLRMLKNREQALARLVAIKNDEHAFPTKEVYLEQSTTYDELYKLTNDRTYLLLKQQADTNLQEGHYWQRDTIP